MLCVRLDKVAIADIKLRACIQTRDFQEMAHCVELVDSKAFAHPAQLADIVRNLLDSTHLQSAQNVRSP